MDDVDRSRDPRSFDLGVSIALLFGISSAKRVSYR